MSVTITRRCVIEIFNGNYGVTFGLLSLDLPTAAATLAYKGWAVFPLAPNDKRPISRHGLKDATTDAKTVHQWWRANPTANIGVATGPLVVVETDGPTGLANRAALMRDHEWPQTLSVMSGRGLHEYWVHPPDGERIRNAQQDGKGRSLGVDIAVRAYGGLVVAPPSRHPNGRIYRWALKIQPQPLPQWMADHLRPPLPEPGPPVEVADATRYVQAAWDRELEAVRTAPDGNGNHQLNLSAGALGRFVASGELDEEDTFEALLTVATEAGHPERSARSTIRSGLRWGQTRG